MDHREECKARETEIKKTTATDDNVNRTPSGSRFSSPPFFKKIPSNPLSKKKKALPLPPVYGFRARDRVSD
jgi:hypothetical protein